MCTQCIYITESIDYLDTKTYQFEELTDELAIFRKNVVDN